MRWPPGSHEAVVYAGYTLGPSIVLNADMLSERGEPVGRPVRTGFRRLGMQTLVHEMAHSVQHLLFARVGASEARTLEKYPADMQALATQLIAHMSAGIASSPGRARTGA